MREKMVRHWILPVSSVVTRPGRISISSFSFSTPVRIEPPPRWSISAPGLFTSKDRMTIMCGTAVKSRSGVGMCETIYHIFVDGVDVLLELCGDGGNREAIGHGAPNEFQNRLIVLQCTILPHQIDLVLEDDNVAQLHDFDGCQVLRRLGLRTCFIPSNEQESSIHDSCPGQHGTHQNIVARAINEAVQRLASTFFPPLFSLTLADSRNMS